MNKSPYFNLQTEPKHCKSEVEEMHSRKTENWPSQHLYLIINTGYHAKTSPSEETISESSQIRESHETIKLLNEKDTFSNASAKAFIFKPR